MTRIEIINALIKKHNYTKYLEIGTQNNVCFNAINIENKVGVDPVSGGTFRGTSDEFFAQNTETFDIIFIDGLHTAEQVYVDLTNAMKVISDNGAIVVHDCLPSCELHQKVPMEYHIWNGDVWKGWVQFISENTSLNIHTVDTDYGVGVILPVIKNTPNASSVDYKDLEWGDFEKCKSKYMNAISKDQFLNLLA